MERRLREETGGIVGHVIPTPSANPNDEYADLKDNLKKLAGNFALVPSMQDGTWSDPGRGNAPKGDWSVQRIGANPPATIDMLRSHACLDVLAACVVSVVLLEKSDGTALREGWRQFLHGSVAPVARQVEGELSEKLNVGITLNFDALFASDLSGSGKGVSVDGWGWYGGRKGCLHWRDSWRMTGEHHGNWFRQREAQPTLHRATSDTGSSRRRRGRDRVYAVRSVSVRVRRMRLQSTSGPGSSRMRSVRGGSSDGLSGRCGWQSDSGQGACRVVRLSEMLSGMFTRRAGDGYYRGHFVGGFRTLLYLACIL